MDLLLCTFTVDKSRSESWYYAASHRYCFPEHDFYQNCNGITVGSCIVLCKESSSTEQPSSLIEQCHRHLWIRCLSWDNTTKGSVIASGAIVSICRHILKKDVVLPKWKNIASNLSYSKWITEHNPGGLDGYYQTDIIEANKQYISPQTLIWPPACSD